MADPFENSERENAEAIAALDSVRRAKRGVSSFGQGDRFAETADTIAKRKQQGWAEQPNPFDAAGTPRKSGH